MAKNYYCKIKGKTYGPVDRENLKKMATEGKLQPSDKVGADISTEFYEAGSIPFLNEIYKPKTDNNDVGDNNRLTNCKTCRARISKNASRCPQCGEDTESSGTKIIMLGFVGLITLGVMIIIGAKFLGEKEIVFRQELIRDYKNAKEKETEDIIKKAKSF